MEQLQFAKSVEVQHQDDWGKLPDVPLLNIFQHFSPTELCFLARVNHHWREISSRDELWKGHCQEVWLESERKEDETFKQIFEKQTKTLGRYKKCYARIKNAWNKIERFLQERAPIIKESLLPGATEEQLNELEKSLDIELPLDVRMSLMVHNGQKFGLRTGVFGGYEFYNFQASLHYMGTIPKRRKNHSVFPIITSCTRRHSPLRSIYVVVRDSLSAKKGQIIELDFGNKAAVFLLAENWTEYLEGWASRLESGRQDVDENQEISLFDNNLTQTAITNNLKVEATPLLAPEGAITYGRGFLFTYRIRISMISPGPKCQLTRRHWEIRDEFGRENIVDGEGVIGFYPSFPGKNFEYCSCTPMHTPKGTMEGHFQFVKEDGSFFNAQVARFYFDIPPLVTINLSDFQIHQYL